MNRIFTTGNHIQWGVYYLKIQRIVFYGWLLSLACLCCMVLLQPSWFSKEHILEVLSYFGSFSLVIYFFVCILRGVFLLPSTPFILVGILLFEGQALWVFVLSWVSVMFSAGLIYRFSSYLGLENYFAGRYAGKLHYLKEKMNTKHGFWLLIAWSFFPLVPTDLMCYVAGVVQMDFRRFMLAVALGETPLIFISVYGLDYFL